MHMKKHRIIILSILIAILLCRCISSNHYKFKHPLDEISQVSIYINDELTGYIEDHTVAVVLEKDEYISLLAQLSKMECRVPFGDPMWTFGPLVLRIDYTDGSFEVIGYTNSRYVMPDGTMKEQYKRFSKEDFIALLSQFLE